MISVVLVTYQSHGVFEPCVEHLASCTSAHRMELIVIDNASPEPSWEKTKQILSSYESRFQSIKVQRLAENRGYAHANNRGAELAAGEFLLLLNPDVFVEPETVQRSLSVLQQRDDLGAVGCRLELPNGSLDKACRRSLPTLWNSFTRFTRLAHVFPKSPWFAGYNLTHLPDRGSYAVGCLCGAFLLMRRDLYQKVGGLDEDYFMYGEDIALCQRIQDFGYLLWYEGTANAVHVKGGNGGKKSSQSLKAFYEAMDIYYRKTHPNSVLGAWIVTLATRLLYQVHVRKSSGTIGVPAEERLAQ
jgi:GT2 family glycosyltransferase